MTYHILPKIVNIIRIMLVRRIQKTHTLVHTYVFTLYAFALSDPNGPVYGPVRVNVSAVRPSRPVYGPVRAVRRINVSAV